jgi:hypothetical protein
VAIANVDTVYNRAIIDLSQNDYTLTIPEIDDRSHVIPFHDLWVVYSSYLQRQIH